MRSADHLVAMITGTFSLVHQLIGMQSFPAVRIEHTSSITPGQVYIGVLNWLLMIGTIAVVGGFGSNTALTSAYGVSSCLSIGRKQAADENLFSSPWQRSYL